MRNAVVLAAMVLLMGMIPGQAWGAIVFSETFDGPNLPTTLTYSPSTDSNITWSISSGRLFCDYNGNKPDANATVLTNVGFIAPGNLKTIYSLDVGIPSGVSPGTYNVGIQFGEYLAVFHPGYTTTPGAFRMEGGYFTSNIDMGFTPALDVLHHMEVVTQNVSGGLSVAITIIGLGTDSQMHTFSYSFLDTTPNLGTGTFGGRRSSGTGTGAQSDAFFDNFQVQYVPEPSTGIMLLLGGLGAGVLVCRGRFRLSRKRADSAMLAAGSLDTPPCGPASSSE